MEYRYKAVMNICNISGIGILDFEYGIEDKVIFEFYSIGPNYSKKRKSKIRYNAKGDAYFISGNTRYYLNEFIKTNLEV